MKPLSKKLLRDIKDNKSQFITIFLMVFLGVFVFAGIHAYMDGMKKSGDDYYESNNLEDIWVTGENFSQEDLDKVKALDNVSDAERKLSVICSLVGTDIELETNFIESNNISKFYVVEGEEFSNDKSGIWLDYYLARNASLNVGDKITLKYEGYEITKKILGLIETPDHVYVLKDETVIFPDHNNFGYAYLSANEFPEDLIIDSIMEEAKITNREIFNMYFKDFKASDYYVFPSMIVKVSSEDKVDSVKADIENSIDSALAVTLRESAISYASYQSEIEEGETYSGVFTFLFLFIALLSVITTMNRFVKKQRPQIGALKALGFKKSTIILHYISFGFYISLIASILGLVCGAFSLGKFFMNMEMSYFEVPVYNIHVVRSVYVLAASAVVATTLVTYLSCRKILLESVAEALRVGVPNIKNTRFSIILSNVFKSASVTTKWNLRDILRNKGRSLMAVVGIIGCTMLLVCAFGMLDSMNSYLDWEFETICNYSYKINLANDCSDKELEDLISRFGDNTSETLGIEIKNGDKKETNTLTVNDALDYLKYTDHKRNYIDISSDGVYITEKLSKTLGLNIGDEIEWHIFGDSVWHKTKIAGLNRDPQNQNLNMTREFFESLDLTYKADTIYTNSDLSDIDVLSGASSIQDKGSLKSGLLSMLDTMKSMIVIMIAVASILAAIIIYNLGILSLSEKQYQFATLKVLGFTSSKIKKIFKMQNIILTVIGLILGLPMGYFITDFIFKMALSDAYDFSAKIKIFTYLYATIGTLVVSVLVNNILAKKINNIDMVTSLKANE